MIKYFCMPTDFKKETIDAYDRLNQSYEGSKVIETYGNIVRGNQIGSGRAANQLPDADLLDLKLFIEYSKKKNIDFNYTINATTMRNREFTREGMLDIKRFLKDIYDAGVRSLTIALPSLLELVKSTGYDFEIKASTLCQITNVNKAMAFKKKGVDRIVVDESINRDFRTLRRLHEEFGDHVELIANPICLKDCIYRMFHYNEITEDSLGETNNVSVNFYEHRCVLQRFGKISNLLRMCFVRPEDIKYYTDIGIHYFKLQGRHLVHKGDAVKTVKAYFDENYDGDVMDLAYLFHWQNSFKIPFNNKKLEGFLKPFFTIDDFCKRDCIACGYCEAFAKKIIDYEEAAKVARMAENFYSQYDKFNGMNQSVNLDLIETDKRIDVENMDVNFELN
jgi:collagenase-like PrtC family protease